MKPHSHGARLPYLDDARIEASSARAAAAQAIRARRSDAALLNLDRMLLHSAAFAQGWNVLLGTVRRELTLDARLRELAICAVARLTDAPYEWHQHVDEWRAAGAREDQVAVLEAAPSRWAEHSGFSLEEHLVLALTSEMTMEVNVSDDTFRRVVGQFGECITVELVGTIAAYNMVARFLVALGIDASGEAPREDVQ